MERWELAAREAIRDLVARYNANGDTGRFARVQELFAVDATMDVGDGRLYQGRDEIAEIFTAARDGWREDAGARGAVPFVRHFVSTHQIDLLERGRARGRCYFLVLMAHGLDHGVATWTSTQRSAAAGSSPIAGSRSTTVRRGP